MPTFTSLCVDFHIAIRLRHSQALKVCGTGGHMSSSCYCMPVPMEGEGYRGGSAGGVMVSLSRIQGICGDACVVDGSLSPCGGPRAVTLS